ncbi:MAG TPA: prepilin-type N-terminal cleavage/methylation domain-containing protein [Gammaproteobacteria bacterium]|jgi:prepilin-type N-terminal cleavage/methylation domain-containing protein|nr:prepilin-type N-terminal cleavage/methylation domain-containing protein [Gammaproteobacteria bacterium]
MRKNQEGFSLIELVLVIAMMGIISTIVGKLLLQGFLNFNNTENISNADWQGYTALAHLTDDIHTIRSAADISTVSATQLTFTNQSASSVQYQLSGSTLVRNGTTVAMGITGITFGYLDKNGTTTGTAANVRYITIALSITQGTITTTYNTLVGTRGMQ